MDVFSPFALAVCLALVLLIAWVISCYEKD